MGSKRLKAIAVNGTGSVLVANPEEMRATVKAVADRIRNSWNPTLKSRTYYRYKYDGLFMARSDYEAGFMAIKNWQTAQMLGWGENNTFEQIASFPVKAKPSCYHCPISCFYEIEVPEGEYKGFKLTGFGLYLQYYILGLPVE